MCTVHYPPDRLLVVLLGGIVLLSVKQLACKELNSKRVNVPANMAEARSMLLSVRSV